MFPFILLSKKRDKKASIKNSFFKIPQTKFYTDKSLVKVYSKKQTPRINGQILLPRNKALKKGALLGELDHISIINGCPHVINGRKNIKCCEFCEKICIVNVAK